MTLPEPLRTHLGWLLAKVMKDERYPEARGIWERYTDWQDNSGAGTEQTAPLSAESEALAESCGEIAPVARELLHRMRAAKEAEEQTAPAEPPECRDCCPATFSGHWRDWHRGHGCNLNPDAKRAADGRSSSPAPQDPTQVERGS